jgi:CheY-like chemotaxis protein
MTPVTQPTILVVEDDATDAFLLRRALTKTNLPCQLRFVSDAQGALNYLKGVSPYADRQTFPLPALVLLDIRFPVLDGLEFLRRVNSHPRFGQLPVVVLASSASASDRALAENLGARAYYIKSGDPRDAVNMFKELGRQWLSQLTSVECRVTSDVSPEKLRR